MVTAMSKNKLKMIGEGLILDPTTGTEAIEEKHWFFFKRPLICQGMMKAYGFGTSEVRTKKTKVCVHEIVGCQLIIEIFNFFEEKKDIVCFRTLRQIMQFCQKYQEWTYNEGYLHSTFFFIKRGRKKCRKYFVVHVRTIRVGIKKIKIVDTTLWPLTDDGCYIGPKDRIVTIEK